MRGIVGTKDFLIIYGSQTGQSETIAKQLQDRILESEPELTVPRLLCMDQTDKQVHIF